MYCKIINGQLTRYKPPIKADGKDIYTNDPTILLEYGWKEVVFTDPEQREGYYAEPFYTETETQIIQRWTYEPIPEPEVNEE